MNYVYKSFAELSLAELYEVMSLRQKVFVVEQNCVYLDADGLDSASWHLLGFDAQQNLLSYARVLPRGVVHSDFVSIGRVVTAGNVRRQGVGKALMNELLARVEQQIGPSDIKISAQCYLTEFYESFGFQCVGENYLEDDIPHVAMIRSAS